VAAETAQPVRRSRAIIVPSCVRIADRAGCPSVGLARPQKPWPEPTTAPAVPAADKRTGSEARASGIVPAGEEDGRDGS